nr:Mediator of RNA polymerase II transcription subunit 14 [Polyrhizophydium stewartii]
MDGLAGAAGVDAAGAAAGSPAAGAAAGSAAADPRGATPLERALPDVPLNNFPLSELLDRTVQAAYSDLLNMAETLPSASNDERKRQLLEFCFAKRKLFTKLLVLLRFSPRTKDIATCQKAHAFIDGQDYAFARAADDLFAIHGQMRAAKVSNFDIPTAVDVLTTGAYQRLPKSLKRTATLEKLEDMIRIRLMCDEVIPGPFRRNMTIENGCVVFTVPGEFTVAMTLVPNAQPHPWRVVDLQILSRSTASGYGGALPTINPMQLAGLKESTQRRLLESDATTWPIVFVYEHLHRFSLNYQIHILSSQARYLAETRWKGHLAIEATNVLLKIDFWRTPASHSARREYFSIHVGAKHAASSLPPRTLPAAASDGIEPLVLESLSQRSSDMASTARLQISLFGVQGTATRAIQLSNAMALNPEALDIEELLISLTDHQSRAMIMQMRDELLNGSGESTHMIGGQLFTKEHIKVNLGVQIGGAAGDNSAGDPDAMIVDSQGDDAMPAASHGRAALSPAARVFPAASLLVMYRPQSWLRLSVDPRTGCVIANLADSSGLATIFGADQDDAGDTDSGGGIAQPGVQTVPGSSGMSAPAASAGDQSSKGDSIARHLKIVENRINGDLRRTRAAILYLRRATTIKQVETAASYLGFEAAEPAQMGMESPLSHAQTEEVRIVHLRFPGSGDNLLVVAAGGHEDLLAVEAALHPETARSRAPTDTEAASQLHGSATSSVPATPGPAAAAGTVAEGDLTGLSASGSDPDGTEFRVWVLTPKPPALRSKQSDFHVLSLAPSDVPGVFDDPASGAEAMSSGPRVKRARTATGPSGPPGAWTRMDLAVLSKILQTSSKLFEFSKLIGQLETKGLAYQFLLRGLPGLLPRNQTELSESQMALLDPKIVIPLRALVDANAQATAVSSSRRPNAAADPNALDPRSGVSNPHGLGDVFLFLQETSGADGGGHDAMRGEAAGSAAFAGAWAAGPTATRLPRAKHAVVAMMRIHALLLPSPQCPAQAGEHTVFDATTHTVTFRFPSVDGFIGPFVQEFQAIGSMLRLMSQLTRHRESLLRMGAIVQFPDLRTVVVEWRGSTILRVGWQLHRSPSGAASAAGGQATTAAAGLAAATSTAVVGPPDAVSHEDRKGRYVVSFERADGQPDEHTVIADLSTSFLNSTRAIFPVVLTLNRVSRLAASLERIRRRRHAFGQTSVELEVVSFTHYRLLFPYFSKMCGLEFVFEAPNSFMMLDAAMPGFAAEMGLGCLAGVGVGAHIGAPGIAGGLGGTAATGRPERSLRPLPEFVDTPQQRLSTTDQLRPGRQGLLSVVCARVADAHGSAANSATAGESALQDTDRGAVLQLPHGLLCTLSLVDTVMACVEAYVDVFTAMDATYAYLSAQAIHNMMHDEVQCRILFTTDHAKSAISCSANGKLGFLIVPKDKTGQAQSGAPESKVLVDKINRAINSIPIEQRNSLQWLHAIVSIAMLPDLPLRELIQLSKFETNPQRGLSLDWCLQVPEGAPAHLPPPGDVVFVYDQAITRIKFLIRFTDQTTHETHLMPIRYNFATGVIGIWRDAAYDAEHGTSDYTALPAGNHALERAMERLAQANMQHMTMPDRIFVQATTRPIPPHLGGPGKIYAALKHLTSRNIADMRAPVAAPSAAGGSGTTPQAQPSPQMQTPSSQ